MFKNKILLLSIIVILLASNVTVFASEAQKPYNLALDNIEKGDAERAIHWLDVVINDFPNSDEAIKAEILKIPINLGTKYASSLFIVGILNGMMNDINYGGGGDYSPDDLEVIDYTMDSTELVKSIDKLITEFSQSKEYLGINSLSLNDVSYPSEFNSISKGLADSSDYNFNDVQNKLINYYTNTYVTYFAALDISDKNLKSKLFYEIASYYKQVNLRSDIEKKDMIYLEVAQKAIDLSISLADKYSDIKIDAQELKEEIDQVKIKENENE